jgi:hypothetical protein
MNVRNGSEAAQFALPLLFFAALLCAPLMAASAYAQDYGDISVKVEIVTSGLSESGYQEFRAMIINRSMTKSHRVTIEVFLRAYGEEKARRTVEVAPSSAMTIPLITPWGSNAMVEVLIDGSRQDKRVEVDVSRANAWVSRSVNRYFLLVSRDVEKSGLMNDAAVVEGFKNAAGENEVAYLAYKSPTPEWSANWVGYSSFDGVMITAEEFNGAPDAVRSALWRFAECGGSLLIIGAWEIPKQWQSRRVVIVEVKDEDDGSKKLSMALSPKTQSYNVGFGQVTIIDAASVNGVLPTEWSAIKHGWKGSRLTGKTYYDLADINKEFPVIERIGIPVRGLFVLMLMFVIVIGPINLIWLARRRKKIWMLWTVPAIALVTCLAVTGFALFGEGVSATSRAEAFTILDESSHRASTIGWMAFYAPITPSEGLHFSYDTELRQVTPESWNYYRRGGGGGDRTIDLSNDQHLDSGWVTARVPAYFKFRKSETRRERLTIRQEGNDAISVVNGLGADVRELWLADRNGNIYSAREIRAGAETKLSLTNLILAQNEDGMRELFAAEDWPGKMKEVVKNPQYFLAPGCYLATLDAGPFVEEGLKNVGTRKGRALVYGISAEAER